MLYVLEHLGQYKKGLASSITRATGVLGLLLGSGTVYVCSTINLSWGWRIFFLLSLPLALIGIFFRKNMKETPEFLSVKRLCNNENVNLLDLLAEYKAKIILVVLLTGCVGGCYQFVFVFIKNVLSYSNKPLSSGLEFLHPFALAAFGISMVATGFISDKFGINQIMKKSICAAFFCALRFACVFSI